MSGSQTRCRVGQPEGRRAWCRARRADEHIVLDRRILYTGHTMERNTRQRQIIRQVFEEANRPLGPQEVLRAGQVHAPRLGIATVYRTLKTFVGEGWLVAVDLPGEPSRYELAGKAHHHHFRCRTCDRVFEIEGCPPNMKRLAPRGFRLEGHEVVLYGRCTACAAPA
jgi:Fur family transcriptional regulator, ferric uptake regulator